MKLACFVLMGFGEKTDYRTQRKLNLDKTYRIIRMAVEESGLECIRADDIIHSGVIDKPMYEFLLEADIVIADLSTSNENAIYELGVRHAMRPHTTVVIAESQFSFPFDINHVLIRSYEHLGIGIDFEEAERLKSELKQAIQKILGKFETDSPVYTYLPDLVPPHRGDDSPGDSGPNREPQPPVTPRENFTLLLDSYHEARSQGDFSLAKNLIAQLRELQPDDPYLIQQQALVTYKSKSPDTLIALLDSRYILEEKLAPEWSSDPETLGLWGAIHKRLWETEENLVDLDTAIAAYERGFYLRRDHYTGINYAFLLNTRARYQVHEQEAIADQVIANRVRQKILTIVSEALESLPLDMHGQPYDRHEAYWLGATRLQALLGLGKFQELEEASIGLFANAPEPWMRESTIKQLDTLYAMLYKTTSESTSQKEIVTS
jgi:hypothetical protein